MVYKRYIKRNGKLCGPYYYESYREGDKVKTRFVSGPKRKDKIIRKLGRNSKRSLVFFFGLVFAVLMIFLVVNFNQEIEIFFVGLVEGITGLAVEDGYGARCVDSDGGENPSEKGSVTGINVISSETITVSDSCISDERVMEYYCQEGGTFFSKSFSCSNGCVDGACVKLCSDSDVNSVYPDGLNPSVKGTVTGINIVTSKKTTVEDSCISNDRVMEYYCLESGTFFSKLFTCGDGCFNGACDDDCVSEWDCGVWSECLNEEQNRICVDKNNCGLEIDKPDEIRVCGIGEELPKLNGDEDCTPSWKCEEWSECYAAYNLDEIVEKKVSLEGEQNRFCEDRKNCVFDRIETKECDTKVPIIAKKVEKCFKDYLEIYDLNDVLVFRLELVDEVFKRLNIQVLSNEFGHCPYCYDNVKNYDEDEIDCVDEMDGNCGVCEVEVFALRGDYSVWIVFGSLVLLTLVVLVFYVVLGGRV